LLAGVLVGGWALLQPANNQPAKAVVEHPAPLVAQNELPAERTESVMPEEPNKKGRSASEQQQTKGAVDRQKQKANGTVVNVDAQLPEEKIFEVEPQPGNEQPMPTIVESNTAEEENTTPTTAQAPKEKKKLRDKIADLFRKKPEEKEEAKPSENENGERRSVRREAGASLAQLVTVRFDIPNDWMLGIKGAKALLTNRSGETLVKAMVEVVYFNDDGDQLDKRTISFSDIKSKQTQTVSVPDHQTATRLEYNVVSATGANEPFARR
jgi:hypothetical protein